MHTAAPKLHAIRLLSAFCAVFQACSAGHERCADLHDTSLGDMTVSLSQRQQCIGISAQLAWDRTDQSPCANLDNAGDAQM